MTRLIWAMLIIGLSAVGAKAQPPFGLGPHRSNVGDGGHRVHEPDAELRVFGSVHLGISEAVRRHRITRPSLLRARPPGCLDTKYEAAYYRF